jgi:flagellar biogenesis protein FliO
MQGRVPMRWVVRTIGLILIGACPVGLSAQVASYPGPASSAGDVAPVVYQQPAAYSGNVNAGARPQQAPAADGATPAENTSSRLPLAPRAPANTATDKPQGGFQSAVVVVGSLAAVLGIFFLIVWLLRRASPHYGGTLPTEAFEVLGRAPLANHQQVHLLRCGNKLLWVSVSAAGASSSARTLTEITDPAEVDRLVSLCRQHGPSSPKATFRQAIRQAEDRHA